ncbi:hypothetical protein JG687_00011390 [Phytophthora cactorum]|uniref:Uncharacterized protein n=1 Tax=Phytophthora cactorum TaxID=29920 RepID=A0A8T1U9V5_9STRA|nr:hypothetical protein JG687_00011390 [Phytophthora cactorum]
MTAGADKAPYGSALKTQCEKKISCTNMHTKIYKGIKLSETRSDNRKRSWKKYRAKRVAFQRNQRATKVFEKLQAFPEPTPKGIADHPLEVPSFHPSLFEFVLAMVDGHEILSKRWFWMLLCHLHQDKLHWLPQEWQVAPKVDIVLESYKGLADYMKDMREASSGVISEERVRSENYRMYLRTTFKAKLTKWQARCQAVRDAEVLLIKTQMAQFTDYQDCATLVDLKVVYTARFVEKEKAYEAAQKAKHQQAPKDLRFLETFGEESDSDDD